VVPSGSSSETTLLVVPKSTPIAVMHIAQSRSESLAG
jgi:hypothetical protein